MEAVWGASAEGCRSNECKPADAPICKGRGFMGSKEL